MSKLDIAYLPSFLKHFQRLEPALQQEVFEKIELLRNIKNHEQLKVHKLKGRLKGRYGFSVNYQFRVVFTYISKQEVVLLAVGDHDVYK